MSAQHNHDGLNYRLDNVAKCRACPQYMRDAAATGNEKKFSKALIRYAEEQGVHYLELASDRGLREINAKMLGKTAAWCT